MREGLVNERTGHRALAEVDPGRRFELGRNLSRGVVGKETIIVRKKGGGR